MNFFKKLAHAEEYIGLALGASNTSIYIPSKDKIIKQPTLITIDKNTKVIAYGDESRDQQGKDFPGKEVMGFIEENPIDDEEAAKIFLSEYVRENIGFNNLHKPTVVMSVPVDCADSYYIDRLRRVVQESFKAKSVEMVYEPLAAAIGAGYDVTKNNAFFVVNIGARITQAAVVALGGIVEKSYNKYAGNYLDQRIIEHFKKTEVTEIGKNIVEQFKIEIGCISDNGGSETIKKTAGGKFLEKRDYGLPIIGIEEEYIKEAIRAQIPGFAIELGGAIEQITEKIEPGIFKDIMENAFLTGGTSQLPDLGRLIQEEFHINFKVAENPADCCINGIKKIIENDYKNVFY